MGRNSGRTRDGNGAAGAMAPGWPMLWPVAVLGLLCGTPALAQTDPTTSVIQQLEQRLENFERESRIEQQGDPVITDPLQRADLPEPGGPTITLSDVVFQPASEFISERELADIASQYVGRPIDFSQIAALVRDVNDIYAIRGIVTASAILPPQDLSTRVLTVQLVEGRLGNVGIVGERRTRDEVILDRVRLVKGDRVVDVPTASSDITFSNRTSLLQMRMLLQPGAGFGLTDIALGITEPPRNQFTAYVDNQGVESTGDITGGFIWRHYGALGIDDSFLMFLTASRGSIAGTVNYDLPISDFGTRLGIGYTGTTTRVVDGPAAPLDVTGQSQSVTATLSQALIAQTNWLVQANASVSYGASSSDIGPVPQVDALTTRVVLGLPITHSGERHSIYVQPQFVYARVEDQLPGADQPENILLFAGNANASYFVTDTVLTQVRGAWQYTDETLIPGNLLFQIGGPTTVRGYPSDGVAGDSGYYVQAEVGYRFTESLAGLNVFAFADAGEVFSTSPARTTLASAGLGMTYDFADQASLELSVGFPLVEAMANQSTATLLGRLTARMF
jgi:hemolysin activation/secretion protein